MLYEIAMEKINYSRKDSYLNKIELNLSTNKENIEIVVYCETKLYVLTLKQKDVEKIYERVTQIDCYQTREDTLEEVKVLLYKKDIDPKLPIKIEDEFVNEFKKLTLFLADGTSFEYEYDKEKNRYCREKTPEQAEVMEVLYEKLFNIEREYFYDRERCTHEVTRKALLKISQDPYLFKWLLELEDYEVTDHNGLYDAVEEIALHIINELDKTGEVLLEIANSTTLSFWLIYYLEQRGDKEQLKKLIPLLFSTANEDSYYLSLVRLFGNQHIYEALESIKETMHIIEEDYYGYAELIQSRANLNDLSVIKQLIREQKKYDDEGEIEKSINKLIAHYGEMKVLEELHEYDRETTIQEAYLQLIESKDKAISYWALQQYAKKYNEPLNFLKYLNSSDWYGRDFIAKEIIKSSDERLNQILKDALESKEYIYKSKYWIVYMLMQRGEDVSHYLKTLQGIKIEISKSINNELRENIVQFWYKKRIAKMDIRWVIEGMELDKKREKYDYKKSLFNLAKSLKKHNLRIKKSQDIATKWQMGWGTYRLVTVDTPQRKSNKSPNSNCSVEVYDEIHLSKISNHAIYQECTLGFYKGEQQGHHSSDSSNGEKKRYFKNIIEEAGINYLNNKEANYVFPNFYIYFLENNNKINQLLFYWVD